MLTRYGVPTWPGLGVRLTVASESYYAAVQQRPVPTRGLLMRR